MSTPPPNRAIDPMATLDPALVYKILTPPQHEELRRVGVFGGSEHDRRDGFVHLSAADQVAGTLAKHYVDAGPLVLLGIDPSAIESDLRWEVSRDGQPFPHLYADLLLSAVRTTTPIH